MAELKKEEAVQEDEKETTPNETAEVPNEELDKIIRNHVYASMAIGLVPIPLVDLMGVSVTQLNLLRALAKKFDRPFFKDIAQNTISALIGGTIPAVSAGPVAVSIYKFVPVIGSTAGALAMPILSGATTYAIGKVFVQHFASGGTFLTFNPDKVKEYYKKMFEEGKTVADGMKK